MSEFEDVLRGYWKAEETRDLKEIERWFKRDAVLVVPELGRLGGWAEISSFYAESVARFAALSVCVLNVYRASEQNGAVEWSSVFGGPGIGDVRLTGVNCVVVENQRIQTMRVYYDSKVLRES